MRFRALAFVLLLAAFGCGSASDADEEARAQLVYEIHLTMDVPRECEGEPSCVLVEHVTWVAPSTGAWRTEKEDGTGFTTTEVSANGMHLVAHSPPPSRDVRIGSSARPGPLANLPPGFEALLAREDLAVGDSLDVERNGVAYTLALADVISLAEADRRGLFRISADQPGTTVSRELPAGKPTTLPVRAYWFGAEVAGRKAFAALDHDGEEIFHVIFYGDPAELAAGKTHAYPGRDVPERELQVVSQPLDHAGAQRDLRAFEGKDGDLASPPLPRMTIRLQHGEEATLFPTTGDEESFAVVTRATLVSVSGVSGSEARRIAVLLRPL